MAPTQAAKEAYATLKAKGTQPLSKEVAVSLLEKASLKVAEDSSKSSLFNESEELLLPLFESEELTKGTLLGQGGFCSVFEIQSITLKSKEAAGKENTSALEVYHTRAFMSKQCIRDGQPRYAIKHLSRETLASQDLFYKGTADLAMEAKFLSILNHAHIIKIRALAYAGHFSGDNFLVIDRLYSTLDQDILKWKQEEKKLESCCGLLSGGKKRVKEMFEERVDVAFDIASAFEYLHSMSVIYRDVKPDNIGFDVRGNVKVFDFGLAKDISTCEEISDGKFNLTGFTGSPIYMAPEVAKMEPYNLSADVYSFAILLWQILALETPFKKYNLAVMSKLVNEKGYRPECFSSWPVGLKKLLKRCWSPETQDRLTFEEVKKRLFALTTDFKHEDSNLDISKRSFHGMKGLNIS